MHKELQDVIDRISKKRAANPQPYQEISPAKQVNLEKPLRSNRKSLQQRWIYKLNIAIPPLFMSANIRNISKKLIDNINKKAIEQGLLLWGKAGVGKSYVACALLRRFICQKKDVNVVRMPFEMLCLKLRDTYKNNSRSELSILTPLLNCDLLVLEDLGSGKSMGVSESDFSLRTILALLDHRIENCLPTIITTNKSLENLASSFDDRIASRLSGFEIIKLEGRDKRQVKGDSNG